MRFTRWDQRISSNDTNQLVSELALWHLSLADCEESMAVASLIRKNDHRALCLYEPDYSELSLNSAIHIRQALAFFQKRQDIEIGVDKEEVAWNQFCKSEVLCRETNDIFKLRASGKFSFSPDVESVLYRAQRTIARILGDVPRISDLSPSFGPGATTQVKKRDASPRSKLGQTFACSEELLPVVKYCLEELQGWLPFWEVPEDADTTQVTVEIHHGDLHFVPKNAKTFRAIVVEPSLNSMYQKSIGQWMARRLRRFGVDITDQTRNQKLACEGSITGALATLDLSSASDTVSLELVYDLLPVDWAHFLSRFRTGTVDYKGSSILLQKFSSMGNGFTFPLETLIFYALSRACVDDRDVDQVSVYGDDIIVPVYAYETLCRVLASVGFIPNKAKSFSTGPFRESCGKDYYLGSDIRPFYLKDCLSCEAVFVLYNFYMRRGHNDAALQPLSWLDKSVRIFGPDGYGDGHLLGVHPRRQKLKHISDGWSGYVFDTFTWKTPKSFKTYRCDRVLPSYAVYVSPAFEGLWTMRYSRFLGNVGERRYVLEEKSPSTHYGRSGLLGTTIPGKDTYKRISVYTLG